jgi:hypothetical protein
MLSILLQLMDIQKKLLFKILLSMRKHKLNKKIRLK